MEAHRASASRGSRCAYAPDIAFAPDGTLYSTWSAPATFPPTPASVSDPARELAGAASPVIDSDGRLVVLYEDVCVDARLPALARVPALAALIVPALAFAALALVASRRRNIQSTPN